MTTSSADTLDILYGKTGLPLRLPAGAQPTVIRKRPMPKLPDPDAAVRAALAQPVGAPPYQCSCATAAAPAS